MEECYFDERGIAYRISYPQENDTNPALIFIHGLSGNASAWSRYEKEFEKNYTIVSLDLRGHGLSRKFPKYHDYDISEFADDVSLLLKSLQITNFIIIAHSFGTLIALEFLLRSSSRTPLILLAPNFEVKTILARRVTQPFFSLLAKLFDAVSFSGRVRGRTNYESFHQTGDWDIRRILRDVWYTSLRAYTFCLTQIYHFTKDGEWKKIDAPVLIIHGAQDTMIPVLHAVHLSRELPQAELLVLENTNHILVLNNFPEVSEAIRRFLLHVSIEK